MSGSGRGNHRSTPVSVLALAALISFVASLWTNLAASTVSNTWVGDHKALIWLVTAFFAALAVLQVVRERSSNEGAATAAVADALAVAVAAERSNFLDQALGVRRNTPPARVTFSNPTPEQLPGQAEGLLVQWRDLDGKHAGDIGTIAPFYAGVRHGRLIVLGAPGAGKTVLLSRLITELVSQRQAQPAESRGPVPVLLNVTGFDPGDSTTETDGTLAARLRDWIAQRLVNDYQVPVQAAADLVAQPGRLLPVLDGLDEMDETPDPLDAGAGPRLPQFSRPRAAALLRSLNAPPRQPVVLASRHREYISLTDDEPGTPTRPDVVSDARHVIVQALSPDAIVTYLTSRFASPQGQLAARWQPVADALTGPAGGGPGLYEVLSNPWELFLAVTAFHDRTTVPAAMLGKEAGELRETLLARLIPATVDADSYAAGEGWTSKRVTRWLATIAHLAGSDRSGTDIRLPDLWVICGRRWPRVVSAISTGIVPLMVGAFFGLAGAGTDDVLLIALGVLVAFGAVQFAWWSYNAPVIFRRVDLQRLRTAAGRRRLRAELTDLAITGVMSGLFVGFLLTIVIAATSGLAAGLRTGPLTGFAIAGAGSVQMALSTGLTSDVRATESPGTLQKQCVRYAIVNGVSATLFVAFAIVIGIVVQVGTDAWTAAVLIALPLAAGSGIGVGMAGNGTAASGQGALWLRYALGTRSAARRDRLPRHTTRFLDWCLERGLLRMSGINIQFRHRRLQDWLSLLPEPAAPSAVQPATATVDLRDAGAAPAEGVSPHAARDQPS